MFQSTMDHMYNGNPTDDNGAEKLVLPGYVAVNVAGRKNTMLLLNKFRWPKSAVFIKFILLCSDVLGLHIHSLTQPEQLPVL